MKTFPITDFTMEDVRLAIITILFRRQMHQKELAEKANCSPGHLSRILSGQTQPSMEIILRIFEALEVKLTLIDESEEKNASSN